jgi:predicted AAA+ superfamily ATPase
MDYLVREISESIIKKLKPNMVVIIFGARRVGQTVLVKEILQSIDE